MNRNGSRVFQRVAEAWDGAMAGVTKMNQSSIVKPSTGYEVFRLDGAAPDDQVTLEFGPVVINLPERANARSQDIFVVLSGWLSLEPVGNDEGKLITRSFSTEVGYFRSTGGTLEHVYGAHYDMDEDHKGHPVFHAQMGSQHGFGAEVNSRFSLEDAIVDRVYGVLRNVRTPSAQMDIFSVLLQVCADHLVWAQSPGEIVTAFQELRSTCEFMIGAAHRLGYLNSPPGAICYRGPHWYKSPAANA